MGYPTECTRCLDKKLDDGLKLSVRPFKGGNNPFIMLVGLNPTLIKREVRVVLDLDDKDSPISKFIFNDILEPVELKPENIYATNLIKCTFREEPRILCKIDHGKNDNMMVKKYLSPYFMNCRTYLKEEVIGIGPRILISFGEVPHRLIVDEFNFAIQGVHLNMKNAFSNVYRVKMLGRDICYVPCIRVVAKNHPHFHSLWEVFIEKLKNVLNTISN